MEEVDTVAASETTGTDVVVEVVDDAHRDGARDDHRHRRGFFVLFFTSAFFCLFTFLWAAGGPRNPFCANRFFVVLTLSVHARAYNPSRSLYIPALGRVLAWATPPPYGTASAHLGYLGGLQMLQTTFQRISVSSSTEGCVIGRMFP